MRDIEIYNKKTTEFDIVTVYDSIEFFRYYTFSDKLETVNGYRKQVRKVFGTFDIESTSIRQNGVLSGFMYIWQFCLNGEIIIGRTWDSFVIFMKTLKQKLYLTNNCRMVIFVHYLPFEFQFFRNFFDIQRIFALDKRQVVTASIEGFDFKCSYKLTNMSLEKFCENSPTCIHPKMSGEDFDYSICRTPSTELTDKELGYSVCDVLGLWESIHMYLKEDTLLSLPITSTGFVRRHYRQAMLKNDLNRKLIVDSQLSPLQYAYLKQLTRGGNTHACVRYSNMILENVGSQDETSSYPARMAMDIFPLTRFKQTNANIDFIKEYACIIDITYSNISLKHLNGVPYIPKSKCGICKGGKFDNGRVLCAQELRMCITDIDFRLIEAQYNISDFTIHHLEISEYGMLPREFRECLMDMFRKKEELRNGDRYLYNKEKNKINASFGMMLTDILNGTILYDSTQVDCFIDVKKNPFEALEKYYTNEKSFLAYQWGAWVTANARKSLQDGIDLVGNETTRDMIYTDTDSVKYIGEHDADFERLNLSLMEQAHSIKDVPPYIDVNGRRVYLGVWENETKNGRYKKFKTLGAKKYISEDINGKIELTLAGVSKKEGSKFFQKMGIEAFNPNTYIPNEYSKRTSHNYHDIIGTEEIIVNGEKIIRGASIGVENTGYSLGITQEYEDLLTEVHET